MTQEYEIINIKIKRINDKIELHHHYTIGKLINYVGSLKYYENIPSGTYHIVIENLFNIKSIFNIIKNYPNIYSGSINTDELTKLPQNIINIIIYPKNKLFIHASYVINCMIELTRNTSIIIFKKMKSLKSLELYGPNINCSLINLGNNINKINILNTNKYCYIKTIFKYLKYITCDDTHLNNHITTINIRTIIIYLNIL